MATTFPGDAGNLIHLNVQDAGYGVNAGDAQYVTTPPQAQSTQYYPSHQQPRESTLVDPNSRRTGKVKFFDTQKGFGFILDYHAEDFGNEEIFVHYTSIAGKSGFRSLAEGEDAEYNVVRGPKGFQAANVTGPNGQPVMGDNKNRSRQHTFVHMPAYASMYPYVPQDPSNFYPQSAYGPPLAMMPPADYRVYRSPMHASSYRPIPSPAYPAHTSPYSSPFASPTPFLPYDIGKDFSVNLSGMSIENRSMPKASGSVVPFGGMFGPIPDFRPSPMSPNHALSTASTSTLPQAQLYSKTKPRSGGNDSHDRSRHSISGTSGTDSNKPIRESQIPPSSVSQRPQAVHSRSSTHLYASVASKPAVHSVED